MFNEKITNYVYDAPITIAKLAELINLHLHAIILF